MVTAGGTLKPKQKEELSASKEKRSGAGIDLLQKLGPGLITGASNDDPSGIATYSQVRARFGYGLLWTMVLTYPLMAAIQEISARIGTGNRGWDRCQSSMLLREAQP
jgi:Mn2+/Fe2+ NRAMP family transporter